jgi:hypothetical protein
MHSQWEYGQYYWTITPHPLDQAIKGLISAVDMASHTYSWYNLQWLLKNGSKTQWETR